MSGMSKWGAKDASSEDEKWAQLEVARDPFTSGVVLSAMYSELMDDRGSNSAWTSFGSRWRSLFESALAEHKNTPKSVLRQLLNNGNQRVKHLVAGNPSTEPVVLLELSRSSRDFDVTLAGNVSASPELLRRLAESSNGQVRKGVAQNPSCPPAVLVTLLDDRESDVKFVASHALTALPEYKGYPLEWIAEIFSEKNTSVDPEQ